MIIWPQCPGESGIQPIMLVPMLGQRHGRLHKIRFAQCWVIVFDAGIDSTKFER